MSAAFLVQPQKKSKQDCFSFSQRKEAALRQPVGFKSWLIAEPATALSHPSHTVFSRRANDEAGSAPAPAGRRANRESFGHAMAGLVCLRVSARRLTRATLACAPRARRVSCMCS